MIVTTKPPPANTEPAINCSHFWPAIAPTDARAAMRLDGTVTPERLRGALIEAAASVSSELSSWRITRTAAGANMLSDVPCDEIDGQSVLVHRWHRAVQCTAAAILAERYRGYDSSATGDKRADTADTIADDLRRDARWAISDIAGHRRSTIELI